jgi:hypothetical protein
MNRFVYCALIALFLLPLQAAVSLSLFGPANLEEGRDATGLVYLNEFSTNDARIDLTSSLPERVWVTPSVIIPSGAIGAQFSIRSIDNTLIEPDYDVEITARYLRSAATNMTVRVRSNDSATLEVTVDDILEGIPSTGRVNLGGTVSAPVTVRLSASNDRLILPMEVVVEAGASFADFAISVEDDLIWQEDESVTVSATADGFSDGAVETWIVNDDVGGLGVYGDADVATIGGSMKISAYTLTPSGSYMYEDRLRTVELSLILADGAVAPGTTVQAVLQNGVWHGEFSFPANIDGPVRIRIADQEGHSSDSQPFDVMRIVPIESADLVFDPRRGQIYASVVANAGLWSNRIVAIDPNTGEVIRSVRVGGDPKQLAMTSGQEFLYAALDANGSVAKVDLDTFGVTQEFALGRTNATDKLFATDIETVKGRPELLVVSRHRQTIPGFAGVAVYENGIPLPVQSGSDRGANLIEPSSDPNIFFGLGTEGDFKFRWLRLGADGIRETEIGPGLTEPYQRGELRSEGDLVVWSSGEVIDGARKQIEGSFQTQGSPCPDAALNRVFFLEPSRLFLRDYRLAAYELKRFTKVGESRLPVIFSDVGNLTRWGTNGLAFNSASNLVIVRSKFLVPTEPSADLSVKIESSAAAVKVGEPFKFIARATNNSANAARNVALTLSDSAPGFFVDYSASSSEVSWLVGGFVLTIPELAAHTAAELEVSLLPTVAGTVFANATVSSTSIDSNPTNDFAACSTVVTFDSEPNSVHEVSVTAKSMVADPLRGLIWISTTNEFIGRAIVSLNPTNGAVSEPIVLKAEPAQLAISRNGRYLYAILKNAPEVQRIDLNTRQPDLRIPVGVTTNNIPCFGEDIEVLDGDGTSIIVSRRAGSAGGLPQGLAVFDGAVQRPETTAATLVANRIEATAATNVFVGYDSLTPKHWLSRFFVDANGVHVDDMPPKAIGGSSYGYPEIRANHSDEIVTRNDTVFNAATLNAKGTMGPPYAFGYPIVDLANNRIFKLSGYKAWSFDANTLEPLNEWNFGGQQADPTAAVRWGDDGFAIAPMLGSIQIVRWSGEIPERRGPNLRDVIAKSDGSLQFTIRYTPAMQRPIRIWTSEDLQTWTEQTTGWREEILRDGWDPGIYRESRFTIEFESRKPAARFVKVDRATQ